MKQSGMEKGQESTVQLGRQSGSRGAALIADSRGMVRRQRKHSSSRGTTVQQGRDSCGRATDRAMAERWQSDGRSRKGQWQGGMKIQNRNGMEKGQG